MFNQLIKYGLVTVLGYLLILLGTYFFVEFLNIQPTVSYFIVITLVYIGVYIAHTTFVFKAQFTKRILIKYTIAVILFWLFNNIFFNVMVDLIKLQYLIAALANIFIFGIIRFLIQRNLVFSKKV